MTRPYCRPGLGTSDNINDNEGGGEIIIKLDEKIIFLKIIYLHLMHFFSPNTTTKHVNFKDKKAENYPTPPPRPLGRQLDRYLTRFLVINS